MSDTTRREYRDLSDEEKAQITYIKDSGEALITAIRSQMPDCRERSLAITGIEQAVMWAVKGITG